VRLRDAIVPLEAPDRQYWIAAVGYPERKAVKTGTKTLS